MKKEMMNKEILFKRVYSDPLNMFNKIDISFYDLKLQRFIKFYKMESILFLSEIIQLIHRGEDNKIHKILLPGERFEINLISC